MTDLFSIRLGDCMDVAVGLPTILSNSVSALVTDPPAGIGFMGKEWDGNRGGRAAWVAWLAGVMKECLRVLRPGAHGLAWALPRTSHWTAMALEDAGFEIRDVITHHFATGFPKSLDVSKAIDAAAGAEREVLGPYRTPEEGEEKTTFKQWRSEDRRQPMVSAPATEAAKQWDGWGTALKPASEHWILVRKPLAGTVAANVQEHETGGLNIEACRINGRPRTTYPDGNRKTRTTPGWRYAAEELRPGAVGRWPANLALSHSPGCELTGHRAIKANGALTGDEASTPMKNVYNDRMRSTRAWEPHGNGDGTETVETWSCALGCPVAALDEQSGYSSCRPGGPRAATIGAVGFKMTATGAEYSDAGGASRFFFCAKPARSERDRGCSSLTVHSGAEVAGARNNHPTVKPVGLMEWLITLITPPGGLVLDPFVGSGTTGVAAISLGFPFLGWEQHPEYFEIARARLAATRRRPEQLDLLGGDAA